MKTYLKFLLFAWLSTLFIANTVVVGYVAYLLNIIVR